MNYLLDTNIISEVRKRTVDPGVTDWFGKVPASRRFISVLTFGEIRAGIERLRHRDLRQAESIEEWYLRLVVAYGNRTITVTRSVAEEWGRLCGARPRPGIDTYLAATARVHDFTLVTRNVKDFLDCDVRVLDPFDRR